MVFGLWFPGVSGRSDRPHCHHDQMLVHKPAWWWYWKELLSGGLISVCWRLAGILRQHPLRPCAQEIQPHNHVCPLLHWNTPCIRHLLTSHQSFFQRISQSPTMFQWYLLIAWVSCSNFPAGLRVLTFHVPTAMFSLPLIFLIFGTPVAYLSPTSRCLTVGAVIVIPGCDWSGIKVFLVFIFMVCLGQSSAWRSPSLSRLFILTTAEIHNYCMARLGHEHMAVDSKSSSALAVDFF